MKNPFKELSPYIESDAYRFKGRAVEIEEMYELFYRNDYLVCYADSGEGKSSIIEAGIIPKIRQNMYLPIHIVFKSDEHYLNADVDFDSVVCRAMDIEIRKIRDKGYDVGLEYIRRLGESMSTEDWEKGFIESNPWLRLRYSYISINGIAYIPVLIFDQFEEVFTNPSTQEWTDRFFAWLQEISTDVCPKRIVEKLKSKVDKGDFPEIYTQKQYKCIFSLRSEYIGSLDYWALQRHYIPLMKSNRYLLRPLTMSGAKEVISNQEGYSGLDEIADSIIGVLRKMQRGKNYVDSDSSDLPCIPALFLSVICSQAFEMTDSEKGSFIDRLKSRTSEDNSRAIDAIIEKFYDKTISRCSIPQEDMNVIEDVLVNTDGNRQRVSSNADVLKGIDFRSKYLHKLENARIIRVVPEYNRTDESIELIHDSLCSVIKRNKEKRKEILEEEIRNRVEEGKKLKRRNEDITSLLLLFALFVLIVWQVSSIFCNRQSVVSLYPFSVFLYCLFSNLTTLPFSIQATIKKLKLASWLSTYGIVGNLLIMLLLYFCGDDTDDFEKLAVLGCLAVGISIVSFYFACKHKLFGIPKRIEFGILAKSIPLLYFWGVLSLYLFFLCIFNKTLGHPSPIDSSWGIIVIPVIVHEIIRQSLKVKFRLYAFLSLCILLGIFALNAIFIPFKLPFVMFLAGICCVVFVVIMSYRHLSKRKCILAVVTETIITISVLAFNLGFNILAINYDTICSIRSWNDVTVKGTNGKYGFLSACYGDTIIPCIVDSVDSRKYQLYLSSSQIHYDSATRDLTGQCHYDSIDNETKYVYNYSFGIESKIMDISKSNCGNLETLEDRLLYYASACYGRIRLSVLNYFKSGKMFSLDDIDCLKELSAIQEKQLEKSLTSLKNKPEDNDSLINFYRAFSRSFYLLLMKDMIIRDNSINIFFVSNYFYIPFFCNLSPDYFNLKITVNNQQPVNLNDLRDGSVDTWNNFVSLLFGCHNAILTESVAKKKILQYTNHTKKLKELGNDITTSSDSEYKDCLSQYLDYNNQAIKTYEDENDGKKKDALIADMPENRQAELKENDLLFEAFINKVFNTLSEIVLERTTIYNGIYINICEQLYLASLTRHYDITPKLATGMEEIYDKRTPFYKEFMQLQELEKKDIDDKKTINKILKALLSR